MIYNVPEEADLKAGELRQRKFISIISDNNLEPINILPFHHPIYHLENLFSINKIDLSFWENHFDHSESIIEALKAINYYRQFIHSIYRCNILPKVSKKYDEFIKSELGSKIKNTDNKKQIISFSFEINQSDYYSFLSSIWMTLSMYYSIFEYVIKVFDNLNCLIQSIFESQKDILDANKRKYLRSMRSMFSKQRENIKEYRQSNTEYLNRRNKNIHEMICGIKINWDSSDKEFYITYTRCDWKFGDGFALEEFFSKCSELQQSLEEIFFFVYRECKKILEDHHLALKHSI